MADGLSVELQPDERLVLVERNTILLDAMGDRNPSRTILGIQRERDGFGAYLYLLDGRRLVLTTNFAR
jgi:hypothetical protein